MNTVLMGQLRALLAALGGWLIAKGYTDSATVDAAMGVAPIVAAMAWSWLAKKAAE